MGRQLAGGLLASIALVLWAGMTPPSLPGKGAGGVRSASAQEAGAGVASLQMARRAVTVVAADGDSQTLAILERIDLLNAGDAPFVPSVTGSQGPKGLLRFALPRNAFDLTLDQQLSGHEVIQVDRGFASLLPLPPGVTTVSFGYRVPYGRGEYELSTSAVYPTTTLWVLVPADLSAASAELRAEGIAEIGRQRYRLLVGENLAAGQRVGVALGGLPFTPRPWLLEENVQRGAALALAALGVLAAFAYAQLRGRWAAGAAPPRELTGA